MMPLPWAVPRLGKVGLAGRAQDLKSGSNDVGQIGSSNPSPLTINVLLLPQRIADVHHNRCITHITDITHISTYQSSALSQFRRFAIATGDFGERQPILEPKRAMDIMREEDASDHRPVRMSSFKLLSPEEFM